MSNDLSSLNSEFSEEQNWLQEETFVVSASRVKENIKKAAASVTVINSEQIELMGANNLSEVLSTIAGIGIERNNVYWNEIESRGIKELVSKQILVMIDGHSLDGQLVNGGATSTFDKMNLDNVERIEVIKGPASALYGANAFTALINIITKKAEDIDATEVKVKVGSYDTKEINILFGEKYDDLAVVANINISNTDGYSYFLQSDASGNSGHVDTNREWFKSDLNIKYKDFYFTASYMDRKEGPNFGISGNLTNDTEGNMKYYYAEAGYNKDINKKIDINTRIYTDIMKFYNIWEFWEGGFILEAGGTNEKKGVEVLSIYNVNDKFTMVFGGNYERHEQYDIISKSNYYIENDGSYTSLSSITDFTDTDQTWAPDATRDVWALYLNNIYDISDDIRFTFGARYDRYSDIGSNISPRGGITWQVNKYNTVKLMYGEGFRAPSFSDLYNSNNSVILAGADKPEKVKTYEFSYETKLSNDLNSKVTLFYNDFSDLIQKDASGAQYYNAKAVTKGLEIDAKYELNRGSYIAANYTYVDTEDKLIGGEKPDVAKHKGNIAFNYRLNKVFNIYNHLFIKGKTKRLLNDSRNDLSGYAVFNTAIKAKDLYKNLELKLSVNNIFDKNYYSPSNIGSVASDYRQPGRNFMFEAKYIF
jgi:iron complex outermembrane receptor protein